MVEPPVCIQANRYLSNMIFYIACQCWVSGCRVLHIEQRLRESTKIMDCLGAIHGCNKCTIGFPVGRNTQYSIGLGQRLCCIGPAFSKLVVFYGIHGVAMPYK